MFTYLKPPEVQVNDMVLVMSLGEAMSLCRELGEQERIPGSQTEKLYHALLSRVEKEGFRL